jgi:4-hydroxybenzoate polyprenyltransferase
VLASDGRHNLRGKAKGARLAERFGKGGFDYAGNSSVDLPVWERGRRAIVVNAPTSLAARAAKRAPVESVFPLRESVLRAFWRALRPYQWVKNLIVLVPAITSHRLTEPGVALNAGIALAAFCLCASGVYLLNDLLDVEADRHHASKRQRPFARGDLPLPAGLAAFPVLLLASFFIGLRLPWGFLAALGAYVLLTTSYSLRLKQAPLLDVFCLAGLYTVRLVAGHEATGIPYSFWLLVFSMFLFLGLALVKRGVELETARQQSQNDIKGRGYAAADLPLVTILGCCSAFLAVLVLALYVNSQEVRILYRHPNLLLLICPLLLYWMSRLWLLAARGRMHDDPVVFALRDPVSYAVGALTLVVIWLATGT